MRERTALEDQISGIYRLERELDDALTLIELGEAEGDEASVSEGEAAIRAVQAEAARRQVETLLSGEADANDSYIEVHSGAGGTESQDWAAMLQRMYARWAERRDYKVELIDIADGEEAGIKGATLLVKGHNAYGWLKTESGVHRLVRISPFDSNARRHTSFASIWAGVLSAAAPARLRPSPKLERIESWTPSRRIGSEPRGPRTIRAGRGSRLAIAPQDGRQ